MATRMVENHEDNDQGEQTEEGIAKHSVPVNLGSCGAPGECQPDDDQDCRRNVFRQLVIPVNRNLPAQAGGGRTSSGKNGTPWLLA